MRKKIRVNEKAHERRVRNAGCLALNSLKGPARQRVVMYWLNVHWDLVALDVLDGIDRKRLKKKVARR